LEVLLYPTMYVGYTDVRFDPNISNLGTFQIPFNESMTCDLKEVHEKAVEFLVEKGINAKHIQINL